MRHSVKSVKGVITVFVALMLVSVLSLGTLVLEAGRYQAAKTQLAEASISASTSMIASYDATLYEKYGLLSIDTEKFTPERCTEYINFNSDLSAGYEGNRLTRMYSVEAVELDGMYNLTYPDILKRQILSRAKYHIIPSDYALNVNTMSSFFTDLKSKCDYVIEMMTPVADGTATKGKASDVNKNMQEALKILYATFKDIKKYDTGYNITLPSGTTSLLPSKTGTVESVVPESDTNGISNSINDAANVLGGEGSILSAGSSYTSTDVDVSVDIEFVGEIINKLKDFESEDLTQNAVEIASNIKTLAQGIKSAINALNSDDEGNLLLNSYIVSNFSSRCSSVSGYASPSKGTNGSIQNATFVAACVEYVFGGNASEKGNQEKAYDYLFAIRMVNNLYSAITNSSSFNDSKTYVVGAHIAWACYESYVDMELMTKYNVSVPFNKNKMILNISKPEIVKSAFSSKNTANALKALGYYSDGSFSINGSNAFSYKDSLAFALWFLPNSEKIVRIADLIQISMRYREQYVENTTATFLMSNQNTYCRVRCAAKFNSILPIVSLGTNGGINGIDLESVKYAGY